MAKQSSTLEWKVLLSDAEWDREETLDALMGNAAASASPERRLYGRLRTSQIWTAALTALVIVAIAASMLWREARSSIAQSESDKASEVEANAGPAGQTEGQLEAFPPEEITAESITAGFHHPMADSQALSEWRGRFQTAWNNSPLEPDAIGMQKAAVAPIERMEIGAVTLRTGLAMVEVTTVDVEGHAYREMHFFRDEASPGASSTLQRTAPSAEFWGSELMVETTHFRFRYHIKDADAVEEAAARLDAIYAQMRLDAGLPFAQDRLEVNVLPEVPARVGFFGFDEGKLTVASPMLLRVPMELTDGEALLKSVVHPLAAHVMAEAMKQGTVRHEWLTMARGVQLWQIYAGSSISEPWYRETVAWLNQDTPAIRDRQRAASTEDLWILCREFYTWQYTLGPDLSLPSLCVHEAWETVIRNYLAQTPDQLDQLLYDVDWIGSSGGSWFDDWAQSVAAVTVVDYVSQVYGRERLPALVAGFQTHESWTTLIPDVFGVSADEFEAEWRRFYGIE